MAKPVPKNNNDKHSIKLQKLDWPIVGLALIGPTIISVFIGIVTGSIKNGFGLFAAFVCFGVLYYIWFTTIGSMPEKTKDEIVEVVSALFAKVALLGVVALIVWFIYAAITQS